MAEATGEILSGLGALSVTFQDTFDTPVFEPLPGETRFWRNTDVIGLFSADTNADKIIGQLIHASAINTETSYSLALLEDKDWSREWMKNFVPVAFGQRLWICPSWCSIPEEANVHVLLDPGLAFGTGSHPTTSLCLHWLASLDLTDKTVIDYGCGSGILAIAALKLGAKRVIGVDIDCQARLSTEENAKRNQVQDKLEFYFPNQIPMDLHADVVVANILSAPLRALAPSITSYVKPLGLLGLSGILEWQAEEVCAAYRENFTFDPIEFDAEWCRITGKKL